jgi:hypothetical protein
MLFRSCISSDHSDEEYELWARTVDLPGFDDNISPHNVITMLLRIVVGEVRNCNFSSNMNVESDLYFYLCDCA